MKPFAFVFPGQGSQSVGMLNDWGDHPAVIGTVQEASDTLGQDIARLIREGPSEELAFTTNTQPVMLVAGVAAFRVWMAETGATPAFVAGHSLGEYAALVASGALSMAQAAPLVRFRAQAMQDAVPVGAGAMAAIIGLDAPKVIALCTRITNATAQISSAIKSDSASTITAKWLLLSTSKDSLVQLKGTRIYSGSGISDYNNSIENLTPNTTYYISDYAMNAAGSNQSEIVPSREYLEKNLKQLEKDFDKDRRRFTSKKSCGSL